MQILRNYSTEGNDSVMWNFLVFLSFTSLFSRFYSHTTHSLGVIILNFTSSMSVAQSYSPNSLVAVSGESKESRWIK